MDAFPLLFLIDLARSQNRLSYPKYLQEISKTQDINDFDKLGDFFTAEIENSSLQTQDSTNYFLFVAEQGLWYFFLKRDSESLMHGIELFKHRMQAIKSLENVDFPGKAWDQYLNMISAGFLRLMRHTPIETFESVLNELDWSVFPKPFISRISTLIGLVYSQEEEAEQRIKARIWLQKSVKDSEAEGNLGNYFYLINFHQAEKNVENHKRIGTLIQQLKKSLEQIESEKIKALFQMGIFELEAELMASNFSHFNDEMTLLEHCQQQLRKLETSFAQRNDLPSFSRARVESVIARLYEQLYSFTEDDLEKASFSKYAIQHIEHAVHLSEKYQNIHQSILYRLQHAQIAVKTNAALTEKGIKEQVQYFKKRLDYPNYGEALGTYLDLLVRNEVAQKSYDLLLDAFKWGNKRMENGGFYVLTNTLQLANRIFLAETTKPGVSWMVEILDGFFAKVQEIMDAIEHQFEFTGYRLIEQFRNAYHEFEPVSHFNIKVYYLYQWYQAKSIRLGALMSKDELSLKLVNSFLQELEEEDNALSFIKADWDEFKKVPNSVRNKTLNKCINISKGDLPLAADHLDFSYRNLRSYITFKEVNRLGFFLDMQQTSNRQLEQGIRYMFYDLYKQGTIFEVVFDMPKFLVNYANTGFFSQDLERELSIKGTTAKKYIKIMIEIGLIRQDKTTGRKHYYRLLRENVMNRLGKDKTTFIGTQVVDPIN
jgi:hypothetical protein